ncbi:MAG: insulinase family protein [bacterium]|nr:insulinase family protein [bacterium]
MGRISVFNAGSSLIVRRLPNRHGVTVGLWSLRGAAHDPQSLAGATHMIEHLTLRQCGSRDRRSLAETMDRLGGGVDAWTGAEMMGLTVQTTRDAVGSAIDLISDAILEPTFAAVDLELERRVILAELQLIQDDPVEQVEEAVLTAAWGDHPLARPIIGSEDSLESLSAERMRHHHRSLIQPGNLLVAVVGDVDPVDLVQLTARLPLASPPLRPSLPPITWAGRRLWQTRSITDQVHVRLAFEGLSSSDPAGMTLILLNRVLGSGASSRLFQRLREGEGLTYDIWSNPVARSLGGLLEVGWTCSPTVFDNAQRVVCEEIRRLACHGPSKEEVDIAKEGLRRGLAMDAETTDGLCALEVSELLERGRSFDFEQTAAEINAVTRDEVAGLSRRILDLDQMASAVAAPEGFVERVA